MNFSKLRSFFFFCTAAKCTYITTINVQMRAIIVLSHTETKSSFLSSSIIDLNRTSSSHSTFQWRIPPAAALKSHWAERIMKLYQPRGTIAELSNPVIHYKCREQSQRHDSNLPHFKAAKVNTTILYNYRVSIILISFQTDKILGNQ